MKRLILAVAIAPAFAGLAMAQQNAEDHAAHHPAAAASAAASAAEWSDGEIRKVDREAKKVTIKHGELKNLDMPPMTMVFQVKDGAVLDKLKAGDKIRFAAEKSATGFVVTDIQPAP
jgi:Cu(I)/Ag(I) efflux system periplasmic protein CusF